MKYYISDLHLGHANMIRIDGRPFNSVEEMNDTIVYNWNNTVTDKDEVYIVGDISMKPSIGMEYMKRLKGKKYLILGNHDKMNPEYARCFEKIDKMLSIRDILDGQEVHVELCHYPIVDWNGMYHGSYLVYGHIHGNKRNSSYEMIKSCPRALNAWCGLTGFTPVTLGGLVVANEIFHNIV